MKIKKERKYSFFQITAFVITCCLILLSIVLIGLIIHKKNEIEALKKKNQRIQEASISQLINYSPDIF